MLPSTADIRAEPCQNGAVSFWSRWRARRRRPKLGRYVPEPAPPPTPTARILEESVLIASSAVRLTVTNAIIVAVLRDERAFNSEEFERLAAERFEELANEQDVAAEAERIRQLEEASELFDDRPLRSPQYDRPSIGRRVAVALRDAAADADLVAGLVRQARSDALDELLVSVIMLVPRDPSMPVRSGPEFDEQLAAFIALDLSELAFEHGVELG